MLYRFCAGAAAADCAKCRGVLFLRFRAIGDAGPYRDVRNFGRGVLTDGAMWASPRRPTGILLPMSVGGGVPDAPPFGATDPTLCKVSGSGAEVETILHLGTVLQISRLSTEKEVTKPWFRARFWVLFPRGKSTPPEAGNADSNANPAARKNSPAMRKPRTAGELMLFTDHCRRDPRRTRGARRYSSHRRAA